MLGCHGEQALRRRLVDGLRAGTDRARSEGKLFSSQGEREVLLEDFYNNDGIDYLKRRPDEVLTEIEIPCV